MNNKKEYINKYNKETYKQVIFRLNKKTDKDLLERLDTRLSKNSYLRNLVVRDIYIKDIIDNCEIEDINKFIREALLEKLNRSGTALGKEYFLVEEEKKQSCKIVTNILGKFFALEDAKVYMKNMYTSFNSIKKITSNLYVTKIIESANGKILERRVVLRLQDLFEWDLAYSLKRNLVQEVYYSIHEMADLNSLKATMLSNYDCEFLEEGSFSVNPEKNKYVVFKIKEKRFFGVLKISYLVNDNNIIITDLIYEN